MNNTLSGLAKGAGLFVVGGVLGGVFTYNTLNFEKSIDTENVVGVSVEENVDPTIATTEENSYYTPAEAMNTVVSIDVVGETQGTGVFGEIFGGIQSASSGSGVIYSEDENGLYIITNNHVVEGGQDIKIRLNDSDEGASASLIGRDPSTDLAVIYVTKEEMTAKGMDDYLVSYIGNSDEIEVFDTVYAIGNAAGEGKSGTTGSVSALNKEITTENGETVDAIQIDAAINPGNSGGALVDEKGQLIGINFAKVVGTELEGMGYSIPINEAVEVANQIISEGTVEAPVVVGVEAKPYMGILTLDVSKEEARQFNINSEKDVILVSGIVSGSPAEKAGIIKGDVIKSADGQEVTNTDDLQQIIHGHDIGDEIKIVVIRETGEVPLNIVLGNSALYQN